jgi:hypothetical protein
VDILLTVMALILPVLLGGLWLNLFVPANSSGRWAVVWGNGALIGLLLIPQLMRILDAMGIPLSFFSTGSLASLLIVLALLCNILWRKRPTTIQPPAPNPLTIPTSQKALFVFLLLLVVLRITTLGLEVLWRPLFPWDATMHWATKARVWFEHKSLVPFVNHDMWLLLNGEGVFTDRHPDYPSMIPLLQVWMNLANDHWNESLMNLPWLLCLVALGVAFYGQLRFAHVKAPMAMAFTYLVLSMPLINIHVALAGYADLFLGACYCAALMAFHNWSISKQNWQGLLTLFFAISCTLIKNEGNIWIMTFIPATAAVLLARREAAKLFILLGLILIFLWLVIPKDIAVMGHTLKQLTPTYNAGALDGVLKSVFLHDSWHLFGFLMLSLIPLGVLMPGTLTRTYLPITVALASAVGSYLFLFLFTGYGWGASNFSAVGRLSIQLFPGLAFLGALLANDLYARSGIRLKMSSVGQETKTATRL